MKFCIVGTGRCGTTLLAKSLNLHDQIFVFNETHFIPKLYEKFGNGQGQINEMIHVVNNSFHITGAPILILEDEFFTQFTPSQQITVKNFCDLLGVSHAKVNGKNIWADKTPDYGIHMNLIQSIWPDCKFIHIMRHGVDTSISMSKHPGYQWLATAKEIAWPCVSYNNYFKSVSITPNPMKVYSKLWGDRMRRIQLEAKNLKENSYQEFKFENLCIKPQKVLNEISDFIGIPVSEKWIADVISRIDSSIAYKHRRKNLKIDFLSAFELNLLHELGYE